VPDCGVNRLAPGGQLAHAELLAAWAHPWASTRASSSMPSSPALTA